MLKFIQYLGTVEENFHFRRCWTKFSFSALLYFGTVVLPRLGATSCFVQLFLGSTASEKEKKLSEKKKYFTFLPKSKRDAY